MEDYKKVMEYENGVQVFAKFTGCSDDVKVIYRDETGEEFDSEVISYTHIQKFANIYNALHKESVEGKLPPVSAMAKIKGIYT